MLDKKDLQAITNIVDNSVKIGVASAISKNNEVLIEQFGEFIENNINPQFGELRDSIANLPTKDYLDIAMAKQRGELVKDLFLVNQKVEETVHILKEKKVFSDSDHRRVRKAGEGIFPKPEDLLNV